MNAIANEPEAAVVVADGFNETKETFDDEFVVDEELPARASTTITITTTTTTTTTTAG